MKRIFSICLFLFVLSSCNVHTFTFGNGPSQGYKKVIKQDNFIVGLITNTTLEIEELNNEKNFKLIIKNSFSDTLLGFLSFGLYTPTTIIILK